MYILCQGIKSETDPKKIDPLDIEIAPLPISLLPLPSEDKGFTCRQEASFFGELCSDVGNGLGYVLPTPGAVVSAVGLVIIKGADYFDRQEQYKELDDLENEARELRSSLKKWVKTKPPEPPKPSEYKKNIMSPYLY